MLLRKINQVIVKQTLGHLEKIARDDVEKYNRFWRLHGKIFKLGYHDFPNRERVSALLRFNSSALADAEALTSLDEYMSRAPRARRPSGTWPRPTGSRASQPAHGALPQEGH